MTAVVGFRCETGIVLGADRQVSAPGAFKYFEKKIDVIERPSGEKIMVGYSGLSSLAREAREKLIARLDETQAALEEDDNNPGKIVQEAADFVLTGMGRLYGGLELELLIGTSSIFSKPAFLEFDGKGIHNADDFSFLGVGDSSLLRYLAAVLFSPKMTIPEVSNLAIYLIGQAISFIDHCGGSIDLYSMNYGGDYEAMPEAETEFRLKAMEARENLLADILVKRPFSSPPT